MSASIPGGRYRIGSATLDGRRGVLLGGDGALRRLRPKAFALLSTLADRPNQVRSRDELTRLVWSGTFVTQDSLTQIVRDVRRALDDPDGQLLQTVSGRGYLLVAERLLPEQSEPEVTAPRPGPLAPLGSQFIGRERELAAVRALLQDHRLVTVVGLGGVGKTRLALRLSADLAAAGTRVIGVDLAPVATAEGAAAAIADGVGNGTESEPANPAAAVAAALGSGPVTLVIDNAEHVAGGVRALLQSVLRHCPGLSVVVTSRISLDLPGESVFRLHPFAVPLPASCDTLDSALQYDSVRLLIDRARSLVPEFRVEDTPPAVLGDLCRKLDGIALAIELAVPRLHVLSPAQLLAMLDQRLSVLIARDAQAPARQRSLRAMLEWSWDALAPADRQLLVDLAVFSGSASLPALVALGEPAGSTTWTVLDSLTELVRASLAIAEPGGLEPRYRLLMTVRDFALEQAPAELLHALRRRHSVAIAGIFATAHAEWPHVPDADWLDRYAPDADNLRGALQEAFGPAGDAALGLRLASFGGCLWWSLPSLPLREGRHWFDLAVERVGPDTPTDVQARLWLGRSWRDLQVGDRHNLPNAERSVALFRALGDPVGLGAALCRAGSALLAPGTLEEAGTLLEEAEHLLRAGPGGKWLALALIRRGYVLFQQERIEQALALYQEAGVVAEQTGYTLVRMLSADSVSNLLFSLGRPEDALAQMRHLEPSLPPGLRYPAVSTRATQLASLDRKEAALRAIDEVLEGAPPAGLSDATARGVETLAMLVAEAGQTDVAARMLGYVLTIHPASRKRTGGRLEVYRRLRAALAIAPAEAVAACIAEGAAWSEGEVLKAAAASRPALTPPAGYPARRDFGSQA